MVAKKKMIGNVFYLFNVEGAGEDELPALLHKLVKGHPMHCGKVWCVHSVRGAGRGSRARAWAFVCERVHAVAWCVSWMCADRVWTYVCTCLFFRCVFLGVFRCVYV